jgi:hypothetical protein
MKQVCDRQQPHAASERLRNVRTRCEQRAHQPGLAGIDRDDDLLCAWWRPPLALAVHQCMV